MLCSSSGWAHGVHTSGTKLVYCYCPARWLYKRSDYFRKSQDASSERPHITSSLDEIHTSFVFRNSLRVATPMLRRWDRKAAASASEYYTTSSVISDEISVLYGREALVVPPPPLCEVDGQWEKPETKATDGFYLVVSRLLPYKNLDRVFDVFAERPDLQLVVVGTGPLEKSLRHSATPNVELLSNVSDRELRWLYGHAGALIAPAFEDYGLTPLEAASFGTPTIALKKGGYLETVADGTSGFFFEDLEVSSISAAIDKLRESPLDGSEIRDHAARFSEERFASTLRKQVALYVQ